jgi:hypothetical protein
MQQYMKNLFYYLSLILISAILLSCRKNITGFGNRDFDAALSNYLSYADSVHYKNGFDYIVVDALQDKDSLKVSIYMLGGSYIFLETPNKIIDFINFKDHDILLYHDFPNDIINIKQNMKLNIIGDIVKKRYPNDYKKYSNDKNSVAPLIYDYMSMRLVFKKDKLVRCSRQYY